MKNASTFVLVALAVLALSLVPESRTARLDGTQPMPPYLQLDGTQPMPPYARLDGTQPMPPYAQLDGTQPMPPYLFRFETGLA